MRITRTRWRLRTRKQGVARKRETRGTTTTTTTINGGKEGGEEQKEQEQD